MAAKSSSKAAKAAKARARASSPNYVLRQGVLVAVVVALAPLLENFRPGCKNAVLAIQTVRMAAGNRVGRCTRATELIPRAEALPCGCAPPGAPQRPSAPYKALIRPYKAL